MANRLTYNSEYHDDWAWSLAVKGCTDEEIASAMHVSRKTIFEWKKKYPSFLQALNEGKDIADSKIERGLYNSGLGYFIDEEERTIEVNKDGTTKLGDLKTKKRYIPPNVTAQIFWLKNRKKEQWRDVSRNEISGIDGEPVKIQQVRITLPEKEVVE
jgi:transcriptional regulator with XRE-family HTH domain